MSNIQNTLAPIVDAFVAAIIRSLRGASLAELVGAQTAPKPTRTQRHQAEVTARVVAALTGPEPKGRKPLARRSPKQMDATIARIVQLLKKSRAGLRSEAIQKALGLARNEVPRPIAIALAKKMIRKTGQKRATVYFARGA